MEETEARRGRPGCCAGVSVKDAGTRGGCASWTRDTVFGTTDRSAELNVRTAPGLRSRRLGRLQRFRRRSPPSEPARAHRLHGVVERQLDGAVVADLAEFGPGGALAGEGGVGHEGRGGVAEDVGEVGGRDAGEDGDAAGVLLGEDGAELGG